MDNYVSNVHKGHTKNAFSVVIFMENMLKNKDILIKDIKIWLLVSRETKISMLFMKH